jgi:membrane-associated phospholipid phosphatase
MQSRPAAAGGLNLTATDTHVAGRSPDVKPDGPEEFVDSLGSPEDSPLLIPDISGHRGRAAVATPLRTAAFKGDQMAARRLLLVVVCFAIALPVSGQAVIQEGEARQDTGDRGRNRPPGIEPDAGKWRTWVISSGKDYRVPPPPNSSETRRELRALKDLVRHNDAQARQQIAFWDAGSPAYRWIDLINARVLADAPPTTYPQRVYAYVALAMYDATVATWESKYHYDRPRPSELDSGVPTALPVPQSPSYPSEHAAAAQAAASVLAFFLPAEAQSLQTMAEQAGWSRVQAGVQYPSDYTAGLALGRAVAERVIAQAMADGASVPPTGIVPTGPCHWIGTNPGNQSAANWTPLLLTSPSQFRPPQPPPCDSAQVEAEAEIVRTYPRTFISNYKAFYWQSPEGLQAWPYRYADKWMFEDGIDQNPPRGARTYALIAAVMFDAFIASQDGKFTYWYIRPPQLNPAIVALFPVPNFPSYPSNHSTFSAARAEMLAYLFPARADFIRAVGKEGGDSRISAGIHFPMDNLAGVELGRAVAGVFIAWAQDDGSQP